MDDHDGGGQYNEYPYPSLSYGLTHPDRLATAASIFGLSPANVEACRVLDIGCAVGGNLIPMAYSLPNSIFTGIDYSKNQIDIGQKRVAELGAENIRLLHMDIMEVPEDFGEFDYIMAHGIYSWVPDEVRNQLMAVIKRHLAPDGVAYISYNVYPGWHFINMVRGMMKYRIRDIEDPLEGLTKAKELVEMLDSITYDDNQAFGIFIESYHKALMERFQHGDAKGETLLLHDELAEYNEPVFLHEFADHAKRHGLQYVSEVELHEVSPFRFPEEVVAKLGKMSRDAIEYEQYIDFLRNRTFRKSILCHSEATVDRRIKSDIIRKFYFSSYVKPAADSPDIQGPTIERFIADDGSKFATDHPLSKAALYYLGKSAPNIVSFDELVSASMAALDGYQQSELDNDLPVLAGNLLRAYSYDDSLVKLHVYRPNFVTDISEKPEASLVARWQAANFSRVTSMRHVRISLDRINLLILSLLDGKHNFDDIVNELMAYYNEGKVVFKAKEESENLKETSTRELLVSEVKRNLEFFCKAALLVG